VTTDTPFTALANGVLVERRTAASTTTWVYEQDEPMATYLATVQIGQYEIRELRGSAVRQRVARSPRVADAVAGDLARQDEMMACFTGLFGQYPFRCYTVVVTDDPLEIPLEAQAMSIFGSNHLAGRGDHERLVAHELAHQWFGNSLTVARWSDIWLNEGFACYAEWLWSEASGEADAQTHADREWTRLHRRPKDLLLADPGPADMFDDRVYKRGALTLHALRTLLGDDAFFAMLQTWVADHRHGSVATADFVDLATATAGEPARDLLTAWLFDRSLPARPGARPRRRS
jgi:aminopeptidase